MNSRKWRSFHFTATQAVLDIGGYFPPSLSHFYLLYLWWTWNIHHKSCADIHTLHTFCRQESRGWPDKSENKVQGKWKVIPLDTFITKMSPSASHHKQTAKKCWSDICCFLCLQVTIWLSVLLKSALDQSYLTRKVTCFPFVWVDLKRWKSVVLLLIIMQTFRRDSVGHVDFPEGGFCICGIYYCRNNL